MRIGTAIRRCLIFVLAVTVGWPLCLGCMEPGTPGQAYISYPSQSDCPPRAGLLDCGTPTLSPFVVVKKVVGPRLELTDPQIIISNSPTLNDPSREILIGPFDALSPPGRGKKHDQMYLILSVLRI